VVPDGPPLVFTWGGMERRIERTWGPERIQTGWWRASGVGRDYYRVQTALGHWFWLFRQLADGRWFLHGVFE
jgi:protein ImuB